MHLYENSAYFIYKNSEYHWDWQDKDELDALAVIVYSCHLYQF